MFKTLARAWLCLVTLCLSIDLALAALPVSVEAAAITVTGEARFLSRPSSVPSNFPVAKRIPTVDYLIYPTNDDGNRDHFGTGVVHSNGKVYTGIGDNGGINANAYIYEYDPTSKRLRLAADLQSAVSGFSSSDWGFGKIHTQLNEGNDANIYFAGWWGQKGPNDNYRGDRVFHYNPLDGSIHDHGIVLPQWGPPGGRLNARGQLYYLNMFKFGEKGKSRYVVFDLKTDKVIFNQESNNVGKNQCIDSEGNAYFQSGGGALKKYDPKANKISLIAGKLPNSDLTRCTQPRADGLMYIVSGDQLVSLDPTTGQIREVATLMTAARTLALDPTERYIYYLAGTRPSGLLGVPLVQVDLENGASQKVIAFLGDVLTNDLGYIPDVPNRHTLSMSLVMAQDGRTVFMMLNGRQQDQSKGNVAFVAVHIPDGEAVFRDDIEPPPTDPDAPAVPSGLGLRFVSVEPD